MSNSHASLVCHFIDVLKEELGFLAQIQKRRQSVIDLRSRTLCGHSNDSNLALLLDPQFPAIRPICFPIMDLPFIFY